jgi:hypothetical protein
LRASYYECADPEKSKEMIDPYIPSSITPFDVSNNQFAWLGITHTEDPDG